MKYALRLAVFALTFTWLLPVVGLAQIKGENDVVPRMILNQSDVAPKMNGHLDIDGYSQVGSGFIEFCDSGPRPLMGAPGRYALAATKDALYLAMEVQASSAMSARTGRDSDLYFETSVEFFVLDDANPSHGFHFILNPIGGIYDAAAANQHEEKKWDCEGLQVANNFVNSMWVCEIRLPWKSLAGIDPAKGFRIGMYFSETTSGSAGSRGLTEGGKGTGYLVPGNFFRVKVRNAAPTVSVLLDSDKLVGDLQLSIPIRVGEVAGGNSNIRVWASLLPDGKNLDDIVRNAYEKKVFLATAPLGRQGPSWTIAQANLPAAGSLYLQVTEGSDVLYQRVVPYAKAKVDLAIVYLYTSPDKKKLSATVRRPKLAADEGSCVSIIDPQGHALVTRELQRNAQQQTVDLPLLKLSPGKYVVVAEIFKKATRATVLKTQEAYEKFDHPAWLNSPIGLTNGKAPSPWTPIRVAGERTVDVWGRSYTLNTAGLPDGIVSQKQKMLVRPVSLVVRDAAGNADNLKGTRFEWKSRADDVVHFESQLTGRDVTVSVKGRVEFDGFIWYDMKFIPTQGKNIPTMTLEFPCDATGTTLVNSNHIYADGSGEIPEKGWSKNLLGSSIFWFGNETAGIQWFADDLRGWQLADYARSAEIVTENGVRLVRIHLFDKAATKPNETRKLAFGFQVTPARPLPKDWRNYRINSGVNTNLWIYLAPNTTYTGNLIPAPDTRAKLEDARKRGFKWLPYLSFLNISPYEKEFLYYGEEWRSPVLARQPVANKEWGTYDYMCPNAASYRDYFVAKTAAYVDAVQPGALYYDFMQPTIYQCMNPVHGCLWKDNFGHAQSSMRLVGCREMAKRIYVMLKQKDPEGLVIHHNSGGMIIPISSFSDLTVTGEEFTQDVFREGSYHRLYPLPLYRVNCTAEPWGVPIAVMPEFVRAVETWDPAREKGWVERKENLAALWHLMGLAIVHDSLLTGDNRIVKVMDTVTLIKLRLGWSDTTEFYPYWDPARSIFVKQSPADANVIVSGYVAERGILLVPMNNTDQATEMTIQVKPNRFGREFAFTDERTRETFQTNNGILKISVPARQPRLLVWETKRN